MEENWAKEEAKEKASQGNATISSNRSNVTASGNDNKKEGLNIAEVSPEDCEAEFEAPHKLTQPLLLSDQERD
ncbi:MAG: hypothetical protein L6R41_001264 [Letrouitia leprolyta]|nr:MAG: hypothetical protein L6R41_001264 [Letrouitia leprolyta]